jgi:hypothetical protein
MILFVQLTLSTAISQRAAAAVLQLFAARLEGPEHRLPCANSGRLWLFRLGLYALLSPKPQADDWLWMIDQTVQLGPWKCLVIVGVRVSCWQALERPLRHEDLHLLNLTPLTSSTQEAVAEQLRQTLSQTGRPLAVLSDEGTELKGGVRLFNEHLKETAVEAVPHLHDIKHKAALLLRKQLEANASWKAFVTQLTRTRLRVSLTSLAFLNPPRLRNKARFMNLECLVAWGVKALRFLEERSAGAAHADLAWETIDVQALQAKLGWLREHAESLQQWSELLQVIEVAEKHIRVNGYHAQAKAELAQEIRPLATCEATENLVQGLLEFVQQESDKLPADQRCAGHTEVLESLLGKYKQTQARHSQGGMTASLLNIGAAVSEKTPAVVHEAMRTVSVSMVQRWARSNLGRTLASLRRAFLDHGGESAEQNPPETGSAACASF